jgi:hypothetical protein
MFDGVAVDEPHRQAGELDERGFVGCVDAVACADLERAPQDVAPEGLGRLGEIDGLARQRLDHGPAKAGHYR